MNPDQMPVNSQRDEAVEVFDRLPSADETTRRTARKRQELAEPFEKAVAHAARLAAERIARAADGGRTVAEVEAAEVNHVVKNVSARRALVHVAAELRKRGFVAVVPVGEFASDATLEVTWTCDTPDYRCAED